MENRLLLDDLRQMIQNGKIDTILAVFPDHYGRLIGKRVTGSYFSKNLVKSGMHSCDYLLTADIEMNPQEGFSMTSWDKGYGDFHGVVDLNTLRLIPWLEGTAMVLVDLQWDNGDPVIQSPRAILRKQIERANQAGLYPMMASELEFYLFMEPHEQLVEREFHSPKPSSDYLIDYHILQTSRDDFVIRDIRNWMNEANIPVEFSKGEWGKGQHEINLEYADSLEMADRHVIYKNGVKEIAWSKGCSVTFMSKYNSASAGSSFHLHTSVYDREGCKNLFWNESSGKSSKLFRQFLGGQLRYSRELFLFYASTINAYKRYQPGSFAPTSIVWSSDNRTAGFRIIGHGPSFRMENRLPGADGNPYLAFAATIAAGLAGIEENLDCGEPFQGDAYKAESIPRVPSSLTEAAALFEQSPFTRKAFGGDVVDHYSHHAFLEQKAYDSSVTDWERKRYFDRI